jgi:hypothetical protein
MVNSVPRRRVYRITEEARSECIRSRQAASVDARRSTFVHTRLAPSVGVRRTTSVRTRLGASVGVRWATFIRNRLTAAIGVRAARSRLGRAVAARRSSTVRTCPTRSTIGRTTWCPRPPEHHWGFRPGAAQGLRAAHSQPAEPERTRGVQVHSHSSDSEPNRALLWLEERAAARSTGPQSKGLPQLFSQSWQFVLSVSILSRFPRYKPLHLKFGWAAIVTSDRH